MIACPACGGDTKTLETRTVREGDRTYERRRRECRKCCARITTSEGIIEEGASSNVMMIKTATMETLLRTIASAFAPGTGGRAAELIEELLAGVGRSKL